MPRRGVRDAAGCRHRRVEPGIGMEVPACAVAVSPNDTTVRTRWADMRAVANGGGREQGADGHRRLLTIRLDITRDAPFCQSADRHGASEKPDPNAGPEASGGLQSPGASRR
jgi:hypothetical protein